MKMKTAQMYSPLRTAWTNIQAAKMNTTSMETVPPIPKSPLRIMST